MIVWTVVDGALDLQWLAPGVGVYRFGVTISRAFYEDSQELGLLGETLDWWLTDDAIEGLFADERRQVVLQGFSPREEIVRLAVAAQVGEVVWTETGVFAFWRKLIAPEPEGGVRAQHPPRAEALTGLEWVDSMLARTLEQADRDEPQALTGVGDSISGPLAPGLSYTGRTLEPLVGASYRGIPFYLGTALGEPPGVLKALRGALGSTLGSLLRRRKELPGRPARDPGTSSGDR